MKAARSVAGSIHCRSPAFLPRLCPAEDRVRSSLPVPSLSSMLCRISQPAHLSPFSAYSVFESFPRLKRRAGCAPGRGLGGGARAPCGESADGVKQAASRAAESVPGKRGEYLPPRALAARRQELGGSSSSSSSKQRWRGWLQCAETGRRNSLSRRGRFPFTSMTPSR